MISECHWPLNWHHREGIRHFLFFKPHVWHIYKKYTYDLYMYASTYIHTFQITCQHDVIHVARHARTGCPTPLLADTWQRPRYPKCVDYIHVINHDQIGIWLTIIKTQRLYTRSIYILGIPGIGFCFYLFESIPSWVVSLYWYNSNFQFDPPPLLFTYFTDAFQFLIR